MFPLQKNKRLSLALVLVGGLAQAGLAQADDVTPAANPAATTAPATATNTAPAADTATSPVAPASAAPTSAPAAALTSPTTAPAASTPVAPAAAAISTPTTAPVVAPVNKQDSLRPTGPVTVTADHAEWQQDGVMTYSGHVLLVSSSLTLKGDHIELQQLPDGQYTAKVEGNPAQMDHAASTDSKGQLTPPVNAKANNLRYDSRTSIVDLIGKSVLTRGKDQITGSSIRYNVSERRIEAAGNSSDGQVRIVIQPPPPKATAQDQQP